MRGKTTKENDGRKKNHGLQLMDYEALADGKSHTLGPDDYPHARDKGFQQSCYRWGNRNGYDVETWMLGDGRVRVLFTRLDGTLPL